MRALHAVTLVILGLLSIAPAPGEVGGCGADTVVADPVDFCLQAGFWECERANARGEFGRPESEFMNTQECVDALVPDPRSDPRGNCAGSQWPFDCTPFPTEREAQDCIDQLQIVDNINTPRSMISQCQLCPVP